jgi:hypothetical protein
MEKKGRVIDGRVYSSFCGGRGQALPLRPITNDEETAEV